MKATEWLVRATQDLPTGVTARIKADTLAHLQDAGVDETADVRPLLGRPENTAAELRRLYFTEREWVIYCPQHTRSSRGFGWLTGLFWPAMLIWSLVEARSPLYGDPPLWWGCAFILAVFLVLTQRLHPALCRLWQEASLSVGFPLAVLSLPGLPPIYHIAAVGLLGQVFFTLWKRAARLARTLTLEGEQA